MYEDKTLQCKDCGADFVFSADEQRFYDEKGFKVSPQRCKLCRDRRKQETDVQLKALTCEKCKANNFATAQGGGLTCKSCGATYSVDERIKMEAMTIPHICAECGNTFYVPYMLKANVRKVCQSCFLGKKWGEQGLCRYCGGQMGGMFSKKCKVCGKA